jgi:hypothetical protein
MLHRRNDCCSYWYTWYDGTPNGQADKLDSPPLHPSVWKLWKHHVIQNLHNNGITMIPPTIIPFADFGPILEILWYGTFPPNVNYGTIVQTPNGSFKHTKEICLTAHSQALIKAILLLADQSWYATYQDMSPLPLVRKNIGLMIYHQLAYQTMSFGAT